MVGVGPREAEGADRARTPRRRPEGRRAQKVSLAIAQRIVDDITEDKLEPGTKLATEREMMARFATGRGTLRESLRFLEMSGVINVKAGPQGGPFVSEPDAHDLAGTLGLFSQLRGLPFKALVSAREILEPELAALAAESAADEDIAEIEDSIAGMREFLSDEQNFLAENDRFHAAVAAAAGNELFGLLISSLHLITDGMPLGVSYPETRRAAVLRAHEAVFEAISTKDPEGARWAMRRHMREFRRYVGEKFPLVYERPVRWRDIAP
ncbi:FadR/GntR family transcriptional regulator [Amycolatopsis taiwanensis]|uniref:GntR family transcriptional regulator n=1 Tax=Amycolatopsis taiwanensis TaxID=342230 RepID=A0A9W6R6L6_9PSEU|nr:FCD domain-containing protein [Amycolatopsis taiwanensis]GLY70218.1 GntR family transcriptional regulator [Amycolatopsis taiwanensis]